MKLERFKRLKPFKIVECDKNVGSALISIKNYNSLCLKSLDSSDFLNLETDPLSEVSNNIESTLKDLFVNDQISKRMFNFTSPRHPRLGTYRLFMKLHKSKFSTRPIINCRNHPTENLSFILDSIIKPLIKKTESYLQDSQNLIQVALNLTFPKGSRLVSLDFEALYNNIIHEDCLNTICDFMKDKFQLSSDITLTAFRCFLNLVLNNNYFKFRNSYYKQNKGIVMGTKAGPSIANLYLYILERKFLFIHKPLLYKRFIDDIFIIVLRDFDLNNLTISFRNLNLIVSSSDKDVIFLDLVINLCANTNKLIFSAYIKPTNTFSYLPTNSNHKNSIICNNPLSLFK